jgi:hypothetical protein
MLILAKVVEQLVMVVEENVIMKWEEPDERPRPFPSPVPYRCW